MVITFLIKIKSTVQNYATKCQQIIKKILFRYEEDDDHMLEVSSKAYKHLQEENSIHDVDDDMELVKKRGHLVGETPCGKCGYLYKSIDDFNQHIKTYHLGEFEHHPTTTTSTSDTYQTMQKQHCDLSKTMSKEHLFESPETSPAEKKTFDFEKHKPQSASQYIMGDDIVGSKKAYHTISTPPLTPHQNDIKQAHVDEKPQEAEQSTLKYPISQMVALSESLSRGQNENHSNPLLEFNKYGNTVYNEASSWQEVPTITQTLHVDVGNEQLPAEFIKEGLLSHTKRKQLLQVANTLDSTRTVVNQQLKGHEKHESSSNIGHNIPTSFTPTQTLSSNLTINPSNRINENRMPPPPPYFSTYSTTFPSNSDQIHNSLKNSYDPLNLNSYNTNNESSFTISKDNFENILKSENVLSSEYGRHQNNTNLQSQQHHGPGMVSKSKQECYNLRYDHSNNIGLSQVMTQVPQFPTSYSKGYQMIGQGGLRNSIQMPLSQGSSVYVNHSSQPVPTMVRSPEQLHNWQRLQYMQQWQQQHTSNWNLLNPHLARFSNETIIPSNLHSSNSIPNVDNSSSFPYIPSTIYENYATRTHASSNHNLNNPADINVHQQNNLMQKTLHPLNPLIQQVQSIVSQQHPRKIQRYSSMSSMNSIYPSSGIGNMPPNQEVDIHRCHSSPDHKCILANCCGHGKRGGKRKRVQEKENLNSQQLEEMKNMEWEKREGYKCKVCDVRFLNQQLLIDHLSENRCKRN